MSTFLFLSFFIIILIYLLPYLYLFLAVLVLCISSIFSSYFVLTPLPLLLYASIVSATNFTYYPNAVDRLDSICDINAQIQRYIETQKLS